MTGEGGNGSVNVALMNAAVGSTRSAAASALRNLLVAVFRFVGRARVVVDVEPTASAGVDVFATGFIVVIFVVVTATDAASAGRHTDGVVVAVTLQLLQSGAVEFRSQRGTRR